MKNRFSMWLMRSLSALALSLGLGLAMPSHAARLTWAQLPPTEQQALAPLQTHWARMPEAAQLRWRAIAQRDPKLAPQQQIRLHKRMQQWAQLSPEERQAARTNFRAAQHQREQSAQSRAKWQHYQALSPEAKAALRQQRRQHQLPNTVPHAPATPQP